MKNIIATVQAGQPQVLDMANAGLGAVSFPLGISVFPTAGGTAKVEISRSPNAVSDPANANWVDSTLANITTKTEGTIYGPCSALRLSSATQPTTFELVSQ